MGYSIDDPGISAFTAIIQVSAVMATLVFFRADIRHLITAWVRGLANDEHRADPDYRFGWQ